MIDAIPKNRFMALSDEEKESIRLQLLDELQQEHDQREARAHQKRARQNLGTIREETYRNQEIKQVQSSIRKNFYQANGYKLEKDPTGRDMWLSPAEQENRKIRSKKRSRRKTNKASITKRNNIIMYSSVILLAIIIGLFISS